MTRKTLQLIGSIMGFLVGLVLLFDLFWIGIIILLLTYLLASIEVEER